MPDIPPDRADLEDGAVWPWLLREPVRDLVTDEGKSWLELMGLRELTAADFEADFEGEETEREDYEDGADRCRAVGTATRRRGSRP